MGPKLVKSRNNINDIKNRFILKINCFYLYFKSLIFKYVFTFGFTSCQKKLISPPQKKIPKFKKKSSTLIIDK